MIDLAAEDRRRIFRKVYGGLASWVALYILCTMETEPAVIAARSRRQALDWSLVLKSQDIEHVIQPPGETHGWQLLVSPAELDRALAEIRLFREENRRSRWQQELPMGGLIFDWRSALWFALLAVIYWLSETISPGLRAEGAMDTQAVWAGQWWRLFTAVTLHADPPHLAANVTFGVLLLGLAMGTFGPGIALLASYFAGAYGNVASLLLYPGAHRSLGASGMVMGALGLLAGQSVPLFRRGLPAGQILVRGFLAGFLLLVMIGLNPITDVAAHVGGFVTGVAFGALLGWPAVAKAIHQLRWNRLAELLCGALVILTWWLALRGGH